MSLTDVGRREGRDTVERKRKMGRKRNIACVYAYIDDGETVYIGSTKDLRTSIRLHKNDPYADAEVWYLECASEQEMLFLREYFVRKRRPKFNGKFGLYSSPAYDIEGAQWKKYDPNEENSQGYTIEQLTRAREVIDDIAACWKGGKAEYQCSTEAFFSIDTRLTEALPVEMLSKTECKIVFNQAVTAEVFKNLIYNISEQIWECKANARTN